MTTVPELNWVPCCQLLASIFSKPAPKANELSQGRSSKIDLKIKIYRVFFFHWYHLKKFKYGKPRLGAGVSGNSRSRPFSGIRASDSRSQSLGMSFSFPFPFPKVGNAFSIPVPKIWECNFPFPFPLMGMDYHIGNRMGMEFKSWDLEGFWLIK